MRWGRRSPIRCSRRSGIISDGEDCDDQGCCSCRGDGGHAVRGRGSGEPVVYTWTGYGVNVPGSSKCVTYKMTITVTVDGNAVKGLFQQDGRPERKFETTLGKNGAIKTAAAVGGGGMMDVIGQIKDGDSKITLDGYCKFEGALTKKSGSARRAPRTGNASTVQPLSRPDRKGRTHACRMSRRNSWPAWPCRSRPVRRRRSTRSPNRSGAASPRFPVMSPA